MSTADFTGIEWRTSSYSSDAGHCVEVAFAPAQWGAGGYSSEAGHCVQAMVTGRTVGLRDSKDPVGGSLVVPSPAWNAFLDGLR